MEQSQQTQATQLDADTQNYWPLGYFEGQDSIRLEGVQNDGDFEMKYGGIEGRLVREYRRKTENAELLNLPMYKNILESMEGYLLGSGEQCHLRLEESGGNKIQCTIKMQHEKIMDKKEISMFVIYNECCKALLVNGVKIEPNERRYIFDKDKLKIGDMEYNVEIISQRSLSTEGEQQQFSEKVRGEYKFIERIGSGNFAVVWLAIELCSGRECAVKVINKKKQMLKTGLNKVFEREMSIIQKLRHKHIVECYKVEVDDHRIYIFMECVKGGDLLSYILENGSFNEKDSRKMFVMIASAVRYLHLNNITHRDIKLENILVDVKDDKVASLKLADFGLAKLLGNNEMMKTMCGTPSYLAPEIFCNTGNTAYTKSVDIWAVGVILYALNTAEFPFSKVNMTGTMSVSTFLAHSQLVSSNPKYARMSGPLKELINGMLNTDPIGRFTIDQTLKHSWVVGEFASEQVYYADLVTTAKSSLQFTVRVFGDSCTFGRSKTNNITLDHPKVSAHSFILFYDKPVLSDIFRSRVVAKFMRTGGASIWINDKHIDVNTVVDLFNNDILTILKSSKPNRPCIEFQVKAKHPPSNILVSHQKSVSASNQQILSGTSASRPGLCYTFSQDIVAVTSRHASESKPWAQLYLIENGARTINWLLVKSSYRIGRHAHPANDIVLPFNIISNYHLTISKPTDPVFFCCVADKSSTNGIWLDGTLLDQNVDIFLSKSEYLVFQYLDDTNSINSKTVVQNIRLGLYISNYSLD